LIFIVFGIIGFLKGVLLQQYSAAFFSHIFYIVMPLLMIPYGYAFFRDISTDNSLMAYLFKVIKINFYYGLLVIITFYLLNYFNFAVYDAIDIWNILIAIPLFIFISPSALNLFLALIMIILAGKRVILVVGVLMIIGGFMYQRKNLFLWLSIAILTTLASIYFIVATNIELPEHRFFRTIFFILDGNYNDAFAGRFNEALNAIKSLAADSSGFIIGAGMGGEYYPWPDVPGAENYKSHYAHFSFISYMWVGGIFFAILIYCQLIRLIFSLYSLRFNFKNPLVGVLTIWLLMAIISSLSGAVLMNNSFLWLIIGGSYYFIDFHRIKK
jgi:hypothetical protein